jgi:hypothetical protein
VANPLSQVRAFDEFHDERARAARILNTVNVCDVWMIQRRERRRLAFKPSQPFGIAGKLLGQDLQRNIPPQARVTCTIHLAHAAGPQRADDFVWTYEGAGNESHAECVRMLQGRVHGCHASESIFDAYLAGYDSVRADVANSELEDLRDTDDGQPRDWILRVWERPQQDAGATVSALVIEIHGCERAA